MRRLALRLEYDGTAYGGWQRQGNAPSIQEALEEAVRRVTGRRPKAVAAGRTDAGAHAEGQVAHFRTSSRIPLERWAGALNAHLPPDIAVREAWEPPKGFHARHSAKAKTYRYRIWNDKGRTALLRDRVWHVAAALSAPAMRRAAAHLVGRHDFRAFAQAEGARERKSTVRRILSIRISRKGPLVAIEVTGDGFLTHMVRVIAGTLAEVGKGRMKPSEIPAILRSKDRRQAGPTAPAKGLTLVGVEYGVSPCDQPRRHRRDTSG